MLHKAQFRERFAKTPINARQIDVLNQLLDDFEGELTTSKWTRLAQCSQNAACRDIPDLVERGVLRKDAGGGRSSGYSLVGLDRRGSEGVFTLTLNIL